MKTGFWEERQSFQDDYPDEEVGFEFMEADDLGGELDNSDYNLYDFLHGVCDIFAAKLQEAFGYRIEYLYSPDGSLCHAYCVIDGPKPIYVDVRGMCDDWDAFISEFDDWIEGHDRTWLDIRDTLDGDFDVTQEEQDAWSDLAEQAIELLPDYYHCRWVLPKEENA